MRLIYCVLLLVVTLCSGRNPSLISDFRNPGSATEETVSVIDKSIWCIFRDKNDNMWFGSNGQGVYRYDGKIVMQFTSKDGLCSNQVRTIQEDKKGNIYLSTVGGVSKFDGKRFSTLEFTNPGSDTNGWRLHPDDLWFAGAQDSGVVYRYDGAALYRLKFPKTKAGEDFIARYPRSQYPNMVFSPYDVYSIYKDKQGNLWFGTNMGVCRYDGQRFFWMSEEELGIDDISLHVRSTYEDKEGYFWFTNTMHRFNVHRNGEPGDEVEPLGFRKEKGLVNSKDHDIAYFVSNVEDSNGNLWMVTYHKGVWQYDGKTLTQYLVKDGVNDVMLMCIYKDNKGDLWLGTETAGVYKFDGDKFVPFRL